MGNIRKPGGGRKPTKPEYSASKNLAQQMEAAADLYADKMSLQSIADALSLNPIKVRKLLITAGVYESDRPCFGCQAWHITPGRKRSLLHLPDLRSEAESLA